MCKSDKVLLRLPYTMMISESISGHMFYTLLQEIRPIGVFASSNSCIN